MLREEKTGLAFFVGAMVGLTFCGLTVLGVEKFRPEALALTFPIRTQKVSKIIVTDQNCVVITETQSLTFPSQECYSYKLDQLISIVPVVISNEQNNN